MQIGVLQTQEQRAVLCNCLADIILWVTLLCNIIHAVYSFSLIEPHPMQNCDNQLRDLKQNASPNV